MGLRAPRVTWLSVAGRGEEDEKGRAAAASAGEGSETGWRRSEREEVEATGRAATVRRVNAEVNVRSDMLSSVGDSKLK